jgi:hypothetical protein
MMTSTQKINSIFDPIYAHVDYDPKTKDIVSMWVSTPQKFRDTTIDLLLQKITTSFTETIREVQGLED